MHTPSRRLLGAVAAAAVASLTACATSLSCPSPVATPPSASQGMSVAQAASIEVIDPAVQMLTRAYFKRTPKSKAPSLELDAESLSAIQEIARSIRRARIAPSSVTLIGFDDTPGSAFTANSLLSARHVNALHNLLERMDVDPSLIRSDARGIPLTASCANLPKAKVDDCLHVNRRVEIVVDGVRPQAEN